jgi:hypothetical protein
MPQAGAPFLARSVREKWESASAGMPQAAMPISTEEQ